MNLDVSVYIYILFFAAFMAAFTWLRDYFRGNLKSEKIRHNSQNYSANQRLIKVIDVYDQAKSCEACFVDIPKSQRAHIFGGQPRWIGKHYFDDNFSQEEYPRILVLLLRPGQLGGRAKDFDFEKYDSLMSSMKDTKSWNNLMKLVNADSKHWGRFDQVYKNTMSLNEDFTAFLNIGLCAGLAHGDQASLSRCFEKYSRSLLELFQPNILILNGQKVQKFYDSYVTDISYQSSRSIIEKNLISKKANYSFTNADIPIFTGKPLNVKSYAARSSDFTYEEKLGWEIKYLYPPFNDFKDKKSTEETKK